jgi:hypothetical protein
LLGFAEEKNYRNRRTKFCKDTSQIGNGGDMKVATLFGTFANKNTPVGFTVLVSLL